MKYILYIDYMDRLSDNNGKKIVLEYDICFELRLIL